MYPVSANLHTLAIQDAPKTRVRIYFIGDAVDCTDDNAVQTNGTLLKWAAGDTDSNGRIGQNGVVFNELFNPDKNIQIGRAVSSQIGMTLLNTDGALDNFSYGRCKVYLDVYDSANSAWLACPMGVYIIELPTKRKVQLINAVGFDQMTKLDAICDTWWNGLNWSGGVTLLQIVNGIASQVGVSVSSSTASNIVNNTLTYTSAPFDCVEVTYRELLEFVAEATGTVARFDRNGALDLRWLKTPTISGNPVTINTDTVGNQCLALDVGEYTVAQINRLRIKLAEGDTGATVGTGTNEYVIQNNLFLNGANATEIVNKITPIYNRLNAVSAYNPISGKFIYDWSLEAGDIINIVNDSTTYAIPIFQQTMTWRGGYVVADLICDGDKVRPALDDLSRSFYRVNSDIRTVVIDADRIDLLGYTTINNGFKVNLDGTFEANGATINGTLKTQSGAKSVEMESGMLQFVRGGKTLFSMDYDSGFGGILLNANTNNGVRQVQITGAGGPSSGIRLYDADGTTIIGEMTCSGELQVGTSAGNNLTYDPVNGLSVYGGAAITGNATVFGNISATGNITSSGAAITGNATVSGDISATGDIKSNGKSVVLKTYVDTVADDYTIGANNYKTIPYPIGLNGQKVVSIGFAQWSTISGPISIIPYGDTGANWYMIGAAGTTVTGARFRYWYIDY